MTEVTETTKSPEAPFEDGEKLYARIWRLIGLRGIVSIAFGFVLLVWPSIGLTTMVALVGAFALVNGLMSGAAAIALPAGFGRKGWLVLDAVVGIGIGVAVLVWPGLSAKALLYLIAVWAIAIGLIQFTAAFVLPLSGGRALLLSLSGIVLTAFGAVMFIEPGTGALAEIALVAALLIVCGVFDIELASELRKLPRELKEQFRPHLTKTVVHG